MKTCKVCGIEKKPEEYHKNPKTPDGRLNQCIKCRKKKRSEYRSLNLKSVLERERDYRKSDIGRSRIQNYRDRPEVKKRFKEYKNQPDNRPRIREQIKKHLKTYPFKRNATTAVSNALRSGKLKKMPCSVCFSTKAEAHHEDYTKPLEVVWYCKTHHMLRHVELRKMGCVWDMAGKPVFPSKNRSDADKGLLLDGHV